MLISLIYDSPLGLRHGTLTTINLRRSLSVISTVVSGGSIVIRFAVMVVTEAGMSVNLAVKVSVTSTLTSFMIDILKHCLGRWLVKVCRIIETRV